VVPEDQSGSRIQPRDEREGQHGEGIAIAPLCSLDEFSLVHGHPSRAGAAIMSRLECRSPWNAKGFPKARQRFRSARTNSTVPTIRNTRK
jgi:hypothetical protein